MTARVTFDAVPNQILGRCGGCFVLTAFHCQKYILWRKLSLDKSLQMICIGSNQINIHDFIRSISNLVVNAWKILSCLVSAQAIFLDPVRMLFPPSNHVRLHIPERAQFTRKKGADATSTYNDDHFLDINDVIPRTTLSPDDFTAKGIASLDFTFFPWGR